MESFVAALRRMGLNVLQQCFVTYMYVYIICCIIFFVLLKKLFQEDYPRSLLPTVVQLYGRQQTHFVLLEVNACHIQKIYISHESYYIMIPYPTLRFNYASNEALKMSLFFFLFLPFDSHACACVCFMLVVTVCMTML